MAGTVNKVILVGRCGADPETKFGQDGTAIVNLNIATDEPQKQEDGSWGSRPEWHRLVAYKKTGEIIASYAKKGSSIYVEGKIRTRTWEDKEGVKRYTTEIVVREVVLLGGRQDGQSQPQTKPGTQDAHNAAKSEGYQKEGDDSEAIPF